MTSAGDDKISFRTRKEKEMFRQENTEKENWATNPLHVPKGTMEEIWRAEIGDRLGHISLCSIRL